MAYTVPGYRRSARYVQATGWLSFAGGINIRDDASELGPADVIDAWNITFDERGGAASRLGYAKYNAAPYDAALKITNLYWSPMLGSGIVQAGANLYLGVGNTVRKTFTTSELAVFAELNGKVFAGHPTDGLFSTTDGVTWTAVASVSKPATVVALAVWQNRLWAVLKQSARVQFSDLGDGTAWTANNWVDLREKDNDSLVALHIGSGQDILGRPGLFAFKQDSGYRIHDADTGAYETVDATVGCANARSVVGVGAYVYTLGKRGIFRWQAGKLGALDMSDKLRPLWDPAQINLAQSSVWSAGRVKDRAVFSLTRAGSTANDLALELHTEQGWLTTGSNAMSAYMTSTGQAEQTYGGSPTVAGQAYQLNSGGTDDGAGISWRLQLRWLNLLGGSRAMVQRMILRGRGTPTMEIRRDYIETGDQTTFPFSQSASVIYDSGLTYDSGTSYYVPADEDIATRPGVFHCRQLSLVFTGTSTTTASGPQVLGAGTAPAVGEFALFSVEATYSILGNT